MNPKRTLGLISRSLYTQVLQELADAGVQWVQIDEPVLVTKLKDADIQRLNRIYATFASAVPGLNIVLQTYFESVENYTQIITLPVQGIGLDFVHGLEGNLQSIQTHGFPADKVLGAGIIDGRGIWKASLQDKLTLLGTLTSLVTPERLIVQSSCDLFACACDNRAGSKTGSRAEKRPCFCR